MWCWTTHWWCNYSADIIKQIFEKSWMACSTNDNTRLFSTTRSTWFCCPTGPFYLSWIHVTLCHAILHEWHAPDDVLIPWYAVCRRCENRRRSSASAAEDIQRKLSKMPPTSRQRRRCRLPTVYRRYQWCPWWNMPTVSHKPGSRHILWTQPARTPCACSSFATKHHICAVYVTKDRDFIHDVGKAICM